MLFSQGPSGIWHLLCQLFVFSSSPWKQLGQYEPNLTGMDLEWFPFSSNFNKNNIKRSSLFICLGFSVNSTFLPITGIRHIFNQKIIKNLLLWNFSANLNQTPGIVIAWSPFYTLSNDQKKKDNRTNNDL